MELHIERLENSGGGVKVWWTIRCDGRRLFEKADKSFTCFTRMRDAEYYIKRIRSLGLEAVDKELGFVRENNAEKFIFGLDK